jgi:ABC-type transport system substrate-binding protein
VGATELLEVPPAYYRQYLNDISLAHRLAESGVMLEYTLLFDPVVAPLNESEVRRAVQLAIDNTALAEVTLGGAALDTYPVPSDVIGVDYRGRVEAAKATLAGYGDLDLNPLELAFPANDGRAKLMAERIAINLKHIGIEVNLHPMAAFGVRGNEVETGMLLMPVPLSTAGEITATSIISLANNWGFGGEELASKASEDETADGCCLTILRPQRLVATKEGFTPPVLGLWGEIDFFHLSLG